MSTFAHTPSHNSQSVTIQTHWILPCFCKTLHWFAISLAWSGVQSTFFLSDFISLELYWLLLFFLEYFRYIVPLHHSSNAAFSWSALCTRCTHTHTHTRYILSLIFLNCTCHHLIFIFSKYVCLHLLECQLHEGGGIFVCSLLFPQSLE